MHGFDMSAVVRSSLLSETMVRGRHRLACCAGRNKRTSADNGERTWADDRYERPNLRNRFEEGYGDAKNLRGRHPMASLGFLFIAGSDIPDSSLEFAIDMLRKLTTESDVYDCACLLVIDGAQGAEEDDTRDDRAVEAEPTALLTPSESSDVDDVSGVELDEPDLPITSSSVTLRQDPCRTTLGRTGSSKCL